MDEQRSTVERSQSEAILAARIARALAHPVRVQILQFLRQESKCVMHLTDGLGRPQANISQHLAVLREAGLVRGVREGMTVKYCIARPEVVDLLEQLEQLAMRHSSMDVDSLPASWTRGCGRGGKTCWRRRSSKAGRK